MTAVFSLSLIVLYDGNTAKCTIVEVEEMVEVGQLKPDEIHLPGIYVKKILKVGWTTTRRG